MPENTAPAPKKGLGWVIFGASLIGVFALGWLGSNITQRRSETASARFRLDTNLDANESDNAKWAAAYPREYDSWLKTAEMNGKTKYGGSAERDHLAEHPNLPVMWAGYGFAKDYNAPRGHMYAVEDVLETGRQSPTLPATCWTCKSPDVPRVMARDGVAEYYAQSFDHYRGDVKNPIGCADCHDSKTMELRVSRPALKEGYEAMGKDISKATRQEMRSLVCAQCHVEYYFQGKEEHKLVFPWSDGLKAEDMEKYYDRVQHVDWTHAISGAKMIKMQHPDFEVYSQGIHAARGVSCADCHMPYKTEGGVKFTDHQIRSPLENVNNSCQVCHKWSEADIKARVTGIQDNHLEIMEQAERAITRLHLEIRDAQEAGATQAELEKPRDLVMRAQMFWDYVSANNGMGFHAPQETARVLAKSLSFSTDGRLAVNSLRAKYGRTAPFQMPDLSSKEKSQAFIKPYVDAAKKAADAQKAAAAPAAKPVALR